MWLEKMSTCSVDEGCCWTYLPREVTGRGKPNMTKTASNESKAKVRKGVRRGGPAAKARKKTLVTLLLDRSGSMQSVKSDTIGAINAYLGELRNAEADIRFSLVLFDTGPSGKMDLEKVFVARPVAEVPDLTGADFMPRGGTPLIDAACTTIRAVGDSLVGKEANVVMAIQTDGAENASVENDWSGLKTLIAEKEEAGWEFLFMGCGIDAYEQGRMMGIKASKTLSYRRGNKETLAAFAETARNTARYASGAMMDMGYSAAQKRRAGDRG